MTRAHWLVIVLLATVARAQPGPRDPMWAFPEEPVAYCAFDGGAMGGDERAAALVVAGVRGLLGNVVSLEGGSSIADEIVRPRVLGLAPWRMCVLELEGETVEVKGGPGRRAPARVVRPQKFGAVIEIRSPQANHGAMLGAIEAGLGRDAAEDGSARDRRELVLPDGLKATLSASDDEWRDVAWVSTPEVFVVAFGRGVLEKWLKPTRARRAMWAEQRATIAKNRGRGAAVFEVYVDLNALRRGVPDEFSGGKLDRLVHAWKIANDRTFMVHGRLMGARQAREGEEGVVPADSGTPVLAIDLSWTSRAEKPGVVKSVAVTEQAWPEALGDRGSAAWVVALRSGVPSWIGLGLDTYEALGPNEFGAVRTKWERRVAPMLERIVPRIGEWAVVRPGLELTLQLKPASGQDRLSADLRALHSTLAPTVKAAGQGWDLLAPEASESLRGLSWRVDAEALVTDWRE